MSSRLLRWFVLGFTCLWFGMIVPVHQRGMIQLPGPASLGKDGAPVSHCSRANDPHAPCHRKQTPGSKDKAPGSPENCAVCHFILGLHTPPPVTVYVACLGLLRDAAPQDHAVAPVRHAALPFHGLDPPIV